MQAPARKSNGFTLVEMLVALTIMAMLMAAVAFAFDASVKNYHANEGIYKTTSTARQALLRITTDLRTATGYFDAANNYIRAIEPLAADDTAVIVTVVDPDTNDYVYITYRFDQATNTLWLDKGTDSFALCKNVASMTFNGAECQITRLNNVGTAQTVTDTRNVRIVLTVTDDAGSVTQTLAAAAVIRRNL